LYTNSSAPLTSAAQYLYHTLLLYERFPPIKQVTKVSDKDKSHFIGNTESREKMVEKDESSEDRKKMSKDGADVM